MVNRYVTQPSLKQRTLDWSLSSSVKPQDFFQPMLGQSFLIHTVCTFLVSGVRASSEESAKLCWTWLEANFPAVFARVSTSRPNLLTNVFNCCAGGSYSEDMAQRVEIIADKYDLKIVSAAACR